MIRNEIPLTKEQSAFAAEHHGLVERYLASRGLAFDEFYDVVVFGYLRAVQRYLEQEHLSQYAFSTIAWSAMRTEVSNYYRAARTQMRNRIEIPLEEELHGPAVSIQPVDNIIDLEQERAVRGLLVGYQAELAALIEQGYTRKQAATICGLTMEEAHLELMEAQDNIIRLYGQAA